jgi:GNAT superfamily N-acetyltransferase
MDILPLKPEFIPEAAALFSEKMKRQRQITPLLPDRMEDQALVHQRLAELLDANAGVAAVENGQLVGFIGWYLVDNFRGSNRIGAYVPEWGHAAQEGNQVKVYASMYRSISGLWAAAGCEVHAITLLAYNQEGQRIWYWHGFGLTVVDAIRAMKPLSPMPHTSFQIRKATPNDISEILPLDIEHSQYYAQPPIFMPELARWDAAEWETFLTRPLNSLWLAEKGGEPAGFIRFDAHNFDGVAVTEVEDAVFISGAYLRPSFRGQGAGSAILGAALSDYAEQGLSRCVTNFESFNPDATAFWLKYFYPVCYSLLRVPETISKTK